MRGPRSRQQYSVAGRAGCVELRRSRLTGTMVGLYDSHDAGMEEDPELPWTTVCEEHGTLVCHPTLRLARQNLPYPDSWCDECREKLDDKKKLDAEPKLGYMQGRGAA